MLESHVRFLSFLAGPFLPSRRTLTLCFFFRPGRYDSAERHCNSCPGFQEINSKYKVFPVEITKREHRAIKDYRSNNNPSAETARLVTTPLHTLLVMLIDAGMPLEAIFNVSDTMKVATSESAPW